MDSGGTHLVIEIGDVHDVLHIIVEVVAHHATHDIECNVRARMAHVRRIVHGRATAVPGHTLAARRDEEILRMCQHGDWQWSVPPCDA